LLLDSLHKRWLFATAAVAVVAVAVYVALYRASPGGLTGGSTVGLWYGAIGSGLMVYAGLLSALRKVPSWWWIGSRQVWMRGHIWLGLLSAVFLVCHSGFRWGGPLEKALWGVTIAVLVTGVFGLVLQQMLPRLIANRVQAEAPYEQIPHLCQVMRRQADALLDQVCGPHDAPNPDVENTRMAARIAEDGKAQLRAFYERDVRPFLAEPAPGRSPLLSPLQTELRFNRLRKLAGMEAVDEQLTKLAGLVEERRQLVDQERAHFWMHSWLLLHVPLSAALLVLGVAHAVWSLYY
jgi:hypothetical protein